MFCTGGAIGDYLRGRSTRRRSSLDAPEGPGKPPEAGKPGPLDRTETEELGEGLAFFRVMPLIPLLTDGELEGIERLVHQEALHRLRMRSPHQKAQPGKPS